MSNYYLIVTSRNETYVHGPLNSDEVQLRIEFIKRRFEYDELKVLTESEYYTLERDDFINNTGATD